jgi:Uma2 family endonuclease
MTYEEYLCAQDIDEHTEWVDGEVIPMLSVSRAHAELQVFLLELLLPYLRTSPIGRVYVEPFQMKVAPDSPGRSPDIMFVRTEHLGHVQDLFLDGPADLVIEITSPGTESVDRGDKFLECEKGGVSEYWILDPAREIAEFYVRDDSGLYRSGFAATEGTFHSTVLDGFSIHTEWLWSRHAPDNALRALGIIA